MLKYYTEIYAWTCIRNERQWGALGRDPWGGVMAVSTIMTLHLYIVLAVIESSPFGEIRIISAVPEGKLRPFIIIAVALALAWVTIVRSGRGDALVRNLRAASGDEQRQCEVKLLKRVAFSLVAFFAVLLLIGLMPDPSRPKQRTARGDPLTMATGIESPRFDIRGTVPTNIRAVVRGSTGAPGSLDP